MKKLLTVLMVGCSILLYSCSGNKPANTKHCWKVIDLLGSDLAEICDKTEAEFLGCVSNGGCGDFKKGTVLTKCNYYQSDGPKFCYTINGKQTPAITESQANLYARCFNNGSTAIKITCEGSEDGKP